MTYSYKRLTGTVIFENGLTFSWFNDSYETSIVKKGRSVRVTFFLILLSVKQFFSMTRLVSVHCQKSSRDQESSVELLWTSVVNLVTDRLFRNLFHDQLRLCTWKTLFKLLIILVNVYATN